MQMIGVARGHHDHLTHRKVPIFPPIKKSAFSTRPNEASGGVIGALIARKTRRGATQNNVVASSFDAASA